MTSTKKVSTDENYSYSSLQRHLYQGGFKFCWNIASGQYYVLDSEPLSEIFQEPRGFWHPARGICMNLQKLGEGISNFGLFTNTNKPSRASNVIRFRIVIMKSPNLRFRGTKILLFFRVLHP